MRLAYAKYWIFGEQKEGTLRWCEMLVGREVGTGRVEGSHEGYFLDIGQVNENHGF